MSIGPLGITGSVAGAPFAQGHGADVQRAQQDTSDQARHVQSNEKAEQAAGVGQTEQDEETTDRDADGRRPWELSPEPADEQATSEASEAEEHQRAKDPSGERGRQLDLSG